MAPTFKPHEIEFMRRADLGRLATVQRDGTPQNSPVGFTYNEQLGTIDIAGYRMSKRQKFRNIAHNDKVALVVDDIASRDPWRVRCLEIRGTAEQAEIPASEVRPAITGHRDHPRDAAAHHQFRHRRSGHRATPTGGGYSGRIARLHCKLLVMPKRVVSGGRPAWPPCRRGRRPGCHWR